MSLPTEPIGSIPRPGELLNALSLYSKNEISRSELDAAYDKAVRNTIEQFEKTGSPIITDGEQSKPSFATYPLHELDNLAPDGAVIPFEDGHTRQLPRLVSGPFQYSTYAGTYLKYAKKYAHRPVKQAVIAPSAISLIYPEGGIPGYSREDFINDLIQNAVADIRSCFDNGADKVQLDFTEGRLAVKLDPSKGLLHSFIDLNNRVLGHFSNEERRRIGIHTCPGGDLDSTHSADVDYAELIPDLFQLNADNFYMEMASEKDPEHALTIVRDNLKDNQRVFVGVIDVINPNIETADKVCDRILTAAKYIPVNQLGTTDDCGFSPFGDDQSTARETAFKKIKARVDGTQMASKELGIQ